VTGPHRAEFSAPGAAPVATGGQVLVDSTGEPAFTQFSSSSGGWSAAGSVPYLASQADPYDGWDGNPNHDWTRTLRDDAIERGWPSIGDLQEIRVAGRDGGGDWGGRVTSLRLVGSQRSLTVSGDTVRAVLGLRSTYLTFAVAPGR
jgi:peptidoglycan hydrolase-like amidase